MTYQVKAIPAFRLIFLASILVFISGIPTSSIAAEKSLGKNMGCQDETFASSCPQTCVKLCGDTDMNPDVIRICVDALRAVHNGKKDEASCNTSGILKFNSTSPTKKDPVSSKYRDLCLDPGYAESCPKTCETFCLEQNLKPEQLKNCNKVLRATLGDAKDRSSCSAQASSYNACKKRVADHFRPFVRPKPPPGTLETVFEKRPDCATPLKKLLGNFICLRDESRHISDGVKELSDRGLSGIVDTATICALKNSELKYFTGVAQRLMASGTSLSSEFGTLEACRKSLLGWSNELTSACADSNLPNCTVIVDNLVKGRKPTMDKIESLSSGLKDKLKNVELELNSITFFENAVLDCPGTKTIDPDDMNLDDILGNN